MICVSEYEEDVLQDGYEELLEESIGVLGSDSAMLVINSRHMLSPAYSTSRLSCLLAHMQESMTNLNCLLSKLEEGCCYLACETMVKDLPGKQ
jgi:hypothetical protein